MEAIDDGCELQPGDAIDELHNGALFTIVSVPGNGSPSIALGVTTCSAEVSLSTCWSTAVGMVWRTLP